MNDYDLNPYLEDAIREMNASDLAYNKWNARAAHYHREEARRLYTLAMAWNLSEKLWREITAKKGDRQR